MSVASLYTSCFVMISVFLYGPFCHGAHKLDLSCSHCLQHLYAPEGRHIVIDSSVRPHGSCAFLNEIYLPLKFQVSSLIIFLSYAPHKIQCTRTIAKSFILLELHVLPFVHFHSWILSDLECNCMNLGIILWELFFFVFFYSFEHDKLTMFCCFGAFSLVSFI